MQLTASFDKRKEIYTKYLHEIAKIRFTVREIDLISCILHRRGDKKIADFLSISPKTVEAHNKNVLNKLQGGSKEAVIDFIEKSGKIQYIKRYYFYITIEVLFRKQLTKIGKEINRQKLICYIDVRNLNDKEKQTLNHIEQVLKIANVILIQDTTKISEASCALYVINESSQIADNKKNIALLFNPDTSTETLGKLEYIDFRVDENYCFSVLELIKKVVANQELDQIIKEFQNECNSLKYYCTGEGNAIPIINDELLEKSQDVTLTKDLKSSVKYGSKKFSHFIIFFVAFLGSIGSVLTIWNFFLQSNYSNNGNTNTVTQHNINKDLLTTYFADLSVRNLTREDTERNYNIISQFNPIIERIRSNQPLQYISDIKSHELINYLYNLNAISSYFLFKEHDVDTAEKILRHAKAEAEHYISNRSALLSTKKVRINLDKKIPSEVYTELYVIPDLPEIYTITIYFLGRASIYKKDIISAEKYFALAKELGQKIGLFEDVLSMLNEAIIKGDKADIDIKNKDYDSARKQLIEGISIYEKIKADSKEYKKNYRPKNQNPTIIIPNKDIYNILDCSKRITNFYRTLLTITDNDIEKQSYLEAVASQYIIGTATSPCILEILLKSDSTLTRIAADSYNNLGFFLLEIYDEGLNFNKLKSALISYLNLNDKEELTVIAQLFERACSLSRDVEFAKADAYDGLSKVYDRLSHKTDITAEEKQRLIKEAQDFKSERDKINQHLKRVPPRNKI